MVMMTNIFLSSFLFWCLVVFVVFLRDLFRLTTMVPSTFRVPYEDTGEHPRFSSEVSTYNPFLFQQGYCKLQGFDTHSKSTSGGIAMWTDDRIKIGVGISSVHFDLKDDEGKVVGSRCGACLNLTIVDFPSLSRDLDQLVDPSESGYGPGETSHMVAYVMDRCEDPICLENEGMVDLDVYTPLPRNPGAVSWSWIPCPLFVRSEHEEGMEEHNVQFLFCNPQTCNRQNLLWYSNDDPSATRFRDTFVSPYDFAFVTLFPRNLEFAIREVLWILPDHQKKGTLQHESLVFLPGLGYQLPFSLLDTDSAVRFTLRLVDVQDKTFQVELDAETILSSPIEKGYAGGTIIVTRITKF